MSPWTGPPPVRHTTGRTPLLAIMLVGLWSPGMVLGLWLLLPATAGGLSVARTAMLLLSVLVSGLALLAFWRSQRPRELVWDGTQWLLQQPGRRGDGATGLSVTVRLDLQQAVLLRCQGSMLGSGSTCWLWVEARGGDAHWHLLRCALYFSGAEADTQSVPARPD